MRVEILSKDREKDYEKFVRENGSFYHTLGWRNLLEKTYKFKPFYIIALDNDAIIGVLPLVYVKSAFFGRRLVSLPYSHVVGVLGKGRDKLFQKAKELCKNLDCDYVEIKQGNKIKSDYKERQHYFDSVLDITKSEDELWKGFEKKSVRWGIKKAQASRVLIKEGKDIKDYREFYRLILDTRKSQGLPPYPFRLFLELMKLDYAKLYLAYSDDVCIAGINVFFFNDVATYMYSASRKERHYMTLNGTNLLLWHGIKEARKRDCKIFDFGITPPKHESLLRFKSKWGTNNFKVAYYYFVNKGKMPNLDTMSSKFKLVTKVLKRTPKPILRVSSVVLRHTG